MPTLPTGKYTVRSFFGAVHALLYHCIPSNQSLREYIEMLIVIAKLFQPLIQQYEANVNSHLKINLLVCESINSSFNDRRSQALIGFSSWGRGGVKDLIIEDRRKIFRVLEEVQQEVQTYDVPWRVGNCAEDETFAHLKCLRGSIDQHSGTIVTTLTIDLMSLDSHGPCRQCAKLFKKLREEFRQESPCYIFSIAPVKGAPIDPIRANI
jgi:hypothetical protein